MVRSADLAARCLNRIGCRYLSVPVTGVLDDAPLRGEVDVDQAEALRIAVLPLEIVEQAPRMVGTDVRSIVNRPRESTQVPAIVVDAAHIAHSRGCVQIWTIQIRGAILGDLDGKARILARHLHDDVVYSLRPYLPVAFGRPSFRSHGAIDVGNMRL
jgi:hypothetical protein